MILPALIVATLAATQTADQIDWKHPYGNPVHLVDGGLCVGIAWVELLPGEIATVDYGPDFNVYRVRGPGDTWWGAYSGFAAQVGPDKQHPLLSKDGFTVYRADDGHGYFVSDDHKGVSGENHFFGAIFKDAPTDSTFFSRVSFGTAEKTKCESRPKE